jgi:AraC-like DNA-binding protein
MSSSFESRLLSKEVRRRILYYPRALAAALYIQEHLADERHLEAIAEAVGMCPAALSRYFSGKTGITIASLLRTLRIERALEHIEAMNSGTKCATSKLAEVTGYKSPGTFTRAFTSLVGLSPGQYRRARSGRRL